MQNAEFIFKAIIIGDTTVGKTTLLQKLTDNIYHYSNTPTIGVDYYTINTIIDDNKIKINIWDTAGHERYNNLLKFYYRNNAICYIVYDICNLQSFKSVQKWINEYKNNSTNNKSLIVLLANKIDNKNKRIISYEDGLNLANKNNAIYIEISSKLSINIDKIINIPITKIIEMFSNGEYENGDTTGLQIIKPYEFKKNNTIKTKKCCSIQ